MGALNGSISVKKLFVRGELPKSPRRAYLERIRLRSFRPLRADEEAEERHGWCALGRPLDLEPPPEEVFQGDYLTLGLRWDRYRFPAALLHARLEQAASARRGQSEGSKLSAKARAELRQRVVLELRQKYLPVMRMVDMVWCLGRGEVFFWSHSASFTERLSAQFELTFGLELLDSSPWSAAVQLKPDAKSERALQGLEYAGFHGPR